MTFADFLHGIQDNELHILDKVKHFSLQITPNVNDADS
jgi:hypothetical protein